MGPGRDTVVEAQPTLPGWLECSHRWGDMAAAPFLRTSQRWWTNDRGRSCRIQLLCNVCCARCLRAESGPAVVQGPERRYSFERARVPHSTVGAVGAMPWRSGYKTLRTSSFNRGVHVFGLDEPNMYMYLEPKQRLCGKYVRRPLRVRRVCSRLLGGHAQPYIAVLACRCCSHGRGRDDRRWG